MHAFQNLVNPAEETSLETHFRKIIESTGEDPSREGLIKTPARAARAFRFLTSGYQKTVAEVVGDALFETPTDEMILLKNIELYSLCEHHLMPFTGKCHIAYLPDGKIIGLSKLARIVDLFARRLQVQERLSAEIADTLMEVTGARGAGVIIEAQHLCMMMRGVEKQHAVMTTSALRGTFQEPAPQNQFLSLVRA